MFFSDAILNSKVFLLVVNIKKKIDSFWEKKSGKEAKIPGIRSLHLGNQGS